MASTIATTALGAFSTTRLTTLSGNPGVFLSVSFKNERPGAFLSAFLVPQSARPLKTPVTQYPFIARKKASFEASALPQDDGRRVLVVGATGGVGQLIVASLLEKGIPVRAVARNVEKAKSLFSGAGEGLLEVTSADLRFPRQLKKELVENVGWVVLATGTTAFPSARWQDNNGPEQTDYISVKNFLEFCPKTIDRILLVSSVGVTRYNQLPFNILNLFGVLKYKRMAEEMVQTSGIPYTIFRPGRLTDGPYTSYDLNTLLKATSGLRKSVIVNRGDSLNIETSRIAVAEAAAQALFSDDAKNQVFEIGSVEGPWPGSKLGDWDSLFSRAPVV